MHSSDAMQLSLREAKRAEPISMTVTGTRLMNLSNFSSKYSVQFRHFFIIDAEYSTLTQNEMIMGSY